VRLTIFNGSPRTKKGNTSILLGDLLTGFAVKPGDSVELHYLNSASRRAAAAEAFQRCDVAIIAFPLYVHAMPGIVMTWLEMLTPLDAARQVKIGFIVQSGLPEARQSRAVEAFLNRLPSRLGGEHIGTVVRGGVEAMQFAPSFVFRKMRRAFGELGGQLARDGRFDAVTIADLAGHETMPAWRRGMFRLLKAVGVADKCWDDPLKQNNAFELRFDAPFAPEGGTQC
jgi:NAD(P)H-dependent FMN reductase